METITQWMTRLETELSLRAYSSWGAHSVGQCELVRNGRNHSPWSWVPPTGAVVFFLHLRHSNAMNATVAGMATTTTKVTTTTGTTMVTMATSVVGRQEWQGDCITHLGIHTQTHTDTHAHAHVHTHTRTHTHTHTQPAYLFECATLRSCSHTQHWCWLEQ